MYLKNIEVVGFKSFAQKINFEFHNGITAIVGPNGSGKSNVGDAIRWVLGEQSAKQLRGGNMQDVIFSGTAHRKPLGYAYVAITLDNSDKVLPVDYEEVTVSRRLYRSGESEYKINGTNCRLKDINEMFYDTGIGKEGYSIIGQGQIDKILSGKPEDRRELFDEAVGIVKFKKRKATTLKKLEEEEKNLLRVTDILSELNRQVNPLKRQSEVASVYLEKRDKLKEFEVTLFSIDNEEYSKELKELTKKLNEANTSLEELNNKHAQSKTDYENKNAEIKDLEDKIEEIREKAGSYLKEISSLENKITVLKEQNQGDMSKQTYVENQINLIIKEIDEKEKELQQLVINNQSSLEELNEAINESKTIQDKKLYLEGEVNDLKENIENSKNEIIEILNKRGSIKGDEQRLETIIEQLNIKQADNNKELLLIKSKDDNYKEDKEKVIAALGKISSELELNSNKKANLKNSIIENREKYNKEIQILENLKENYHKTTSRLESLRNLAERYEGYGNSIKKVMEQRQREKGIKGVVADIIKSDQKMETAIETALGGAISNIVVSNQETAKGLINYLKVNKFGRCTFLPLNAIKAKGSISNQDILNESGVVGRASELVTYNKEYKDLVEYLLGRILVVDSIDNGVKIANKYNHTVRIVTLEGDSLNTGGSMTGGAFRNNSNLLGRNRELDELGKKVEDLKNEINKTSLSIDKIKIYISSLENQLGSIDNTLNSLNVEKSTLSMQLNSYNNLEREIEGNIKRANEDKISLEKELKERIKSKEEIISKIQELSSKEKIIEEAVAKGTESLNIKNKELSNLSQKLNDINLKVSNLKQKNGFTATENKRLENEVNDLRNKITTLKAEIANTNNNINNRNAIINEINEKLCEIRENEKKYNEELLSSQELYQEEKLKVNELLEQRDRLYKEISDLERLSYKFENNFDKINEKLNSKIDYLWTSYELTPNNISELVNEELKDTKELKTQISKIKSEIKALGQVNLGAIEEYKEAKERQEFLTAQYDDLQKAKETLLDIIKELDDGMKAQFEEKFKEIAVEFDKAFKELFGGGKGTLELDEGIDILEAGVKIISQPPGKKLQNMMQLSGGEKALTAIALLFAIQNLKPSPFCLLDEIEAALDDSNVGRYAAYLQKLTENTQFIIITHRRGTMVAADRLYGITMQEKGVSTLVSASLIENELIN